MERDRTTPIHNITFTAVTPFQGGKETSSEENELEEKEMHDEKKNQMAKKNREYAERKTEIREIASVYPLAHMILFQH